MLIREQMMKPKQYEYAAPDDSNIWLNSILPGFQARTDNSAPVMTKEELVPANRAPASVQMFEPEVAQPPGPFAVLGQDKYDQLLKRLEARTLEGIGQQKTSAEEMKRYKELLAQNYKPQLDLSPLMALADQWTGSNMARSYQRPETAMERLQKIMNAEQQYSGAQGRIADDEINLLKTQMMGELSRQRLDAKTNKNPMDSLSGEGRKMLGIANEGINAVSGMMESMESGVGPSRLNSNTPFIGTFFSDDTFTANQRIAAEMFGRLQSGGAINKDEESRFIAMGPRPGDSADIAKKKLAAQKQALEDRIRILGVTPDMLQQMGVQSRASVSTGSSEGISRGPSGGSASVKGQRPSFEEWKKSKGY